MRDTVRPRSSIGGIEMRVSKAEATSPASARPAQQSPAAPDGPIFRDVSKERLADRIASLEEDIRITKLLGSGEEHARRISEYRARLEELQQRLGDGEPPPDENSLPNLHTAWAADFKKFGLDPRQQGALETMLTIYFLELRRAAPERFPEFAFDWPGPIDKRDQAYNRWVQAGVILAAIEDNDRREDALRMSQTKIVEAAFHALPLESRGRLGKEPEKAPHTPRTSRKPVKTKSPKAAATLKTESQKAAASLRSLHGSRADIERTAKRTPEIVRGWVKCICLFQRARDALLDVARPLPALTRADLHDIVRTRTARRSTGLRRTALLDIIRR